MTKPVILLKDANLKLDGRELWHSLNLAVAPGEIVAVLGPNGSGKTTFLNSLLGLIPMTGGTVLVGGEPPRRGSDAIGYVPQQKSFDPDLPIRGRDLVRMGLDGHRYGIRRQSGGGQRVEKVLREVGAASYADSPVGLLSGGEQQRLRIAQALLSDPSILLCDEPLLSLDLSHQQAVVNLIDERRRKSNTAVIFVTHEINPVLPIVDRVLYLVRGRWAVGTPAEVFTSEKLSELYGTEVDVLKVRGRIIVVGTGENASPAEMTHHFHTSSKRVAQ